MLSRKVGNVDVFLNSEGFVEAIQLSGRPLYLTADVSLLKKQLRGEMLERIPEGIQTTIRHWQKSDSFYWNRIVGPIFIRSIAEQTLVGIKRLVEGETKQ